MTIQEFYYITTIYLIMLGLAYYMNNSGFTAFSGFLSTVLGISMFVTPVTGMTSFLNSTITIITLGVGLFLITTLSYNYASGFFNVKEW